MHTRTDRRRAINIGNLGFQNVSKSIVTNSGSPSQSSSPFPSTNRPIGLGMAKARQLASTGR